MIRVPDLYQERFGIRIALDYEVQAATLPDTLADCWAQAVAMLIARCPVEDTATVHALTQAGGLLMDTLIYYDTDLSRDIPRDIPQGDAPFAIQHAHLEDAPALVAIAAEAFQGYQGHFHADPRLDRTACDAVYTSWARDSVLNKSVADEVLVAKSGDHIAGFLSLKITGADVAEGPLIAVGNRFRRQGVARALMRGGLSWGQERGLARMVMSTQLSNTPSQRVWVRLGFVPRYAVHTFHLWFDEA